MAAAASVAPSVAPSVASTSRTVDFAGVDTGVETKEAGGAGRVSGGTAKSGSGKKLGKNLDSTGSGWWAGMKSVRTKKEEDDDEEEEEDEAPREDAEGNFIFDSDDDGEEEEEEEEEEEHTELCHPMARWTVDGRATFRAIAWHILRAKDSIFIAGWQLSPDMYLLRPAWKYPRFQLFALLNEKASEGVQVYVLIFNSFQAALDLGQTFARDRFEHLHANIHFLEHPGKMTGGARELRDINSLFWSHHEKIVVVDQRIAVIGGLDLAAMRWDDYRHNLTDVDGARAHIPNVPNDGGEEKGGGEGRGEGGGEGKEEGNECLSRLAASSANMAHTSPSRATSAGLASASGSAILISSSPTLIADDVPTLSKLRAMTAPQMGRKGRQMGRFNSHNGGHNGAASGQHQGSLDIEALAASNAQSYAQRDVRTSSIY
jgi:hypothetical protein